MLEWDDIRHFLAVAREGSTRAAARNLRVNQSTISRHIAALEQRLGQVLFEKHPTGYRPTEFGRALMPYAEQVGEAVAAFERQVASGDKRITGAIRITCPEGLGYRLLTPLIDGFGKLHPQLTLELIIADRFLDLGRGEADVAVRAGAPKQDTLVGCKVADNAWAVYGSRSYIDEMGRPDNLPALNQHRIIGLDGEIASIHAARWLHSTAPHASVAARSNSVIALLLAAKSGVGLAPLPVQIGDPEADLIRVVDPVPELFAPIWLLTHPDLQKVPRIRAFFEFAKQEMRIFRPLLLGLEVPDRGRTQRINSEISSTL